MRCEDRVVGIGGCNAPTDRMIERCPFCGVVYDEVEDMDVGITFVGWTYGKPEDKEMLKALGVRGSMYHRVSHGDDVIEHCDASPEAFWRLVHLYKIRNPGSFTVVDRHDNQLPWDDHPRGQRYWHNLVENSTLPELRETLEKMGTRPQKPKAMPAVTLWR